MIIKSFWKIIGMDGFVEKGGGDGMGNRGGGLR